MRVIPEELQNGAYIKCTIRKAVNDDSEMCDTISQIGHVLGLIGLRENFTAVSYTHLTLPTKRIV